MFDIVESLQGPSKAAVDSDDDIQGQASSSTAQQQPASQPAGRFSLWGMATALAENVKKSTAEIAARFVAVVCCSCPLLLLRYAASVMACQQSTSYFSVRLCLLLTGRGICL